MKKLFINVVETVIIFVCIYVLVRERRLDAIRPHHFTTRVAGKMTSEYWSTNRVDIHWTSEAVMTPHGVEIVQTAHTNILW
jgi:hypothetical protein